MKKTLLSSAYSVLISLAVSTVIMLIASFFAMKLDEPRAVTGISSSIALFGGAIFCGLLSALFSGSNSVSTAFSGCAYIFIILIASLIISGIIGPTDEPYGVGRKIIMIAISFALTFIGSLIGTKRKPKKRSSASIRANMKKKRR